MNLRIAGGLLLGVLSLTFPALPLDSQKLLTQYSRSVWNQEQGLPQDTVHRIAQTTDGFLWIGTAEGLARFDGYEFVPFDKDSSDLPANWITALSASKDGSLWIGTPNGLALYRNGQFRIFNTKDGLPDNAISSLYQDDSGSLWIAAGLYLSRYASGKFITYRPGKDIPISSVRTVGGNHKGEFWVAGLGGVAQWVNGKFQSVVDAAALGGHIPVALLSDSRDHLWIAGTEGLMVHSPDGKIRRYDSSDGLPDNSVRAILEDAHGNIWAGTNGGIARFEHGQFAAFSATESRDRDMVFSLFEDRERNLWVGTNSGLNRFRDDIFTVYGTSEGLPSDVPNSVFQDRRGRIWVGFHNSGLMLFSHSRHEPHRVYTTKHGLPVNEILSIRESRTGHLLLGTTAGLVRMSGDAFTTYRPPDPLARGTVHDALEDSKGRLWLATPGGLGELRNGRFQIIIPGGPLLSSSFGVIAEARDGSIWAGTLGRGLWLIKDGPPRLFTTAEGLSSNGIRSLYEDSEGTLWIGTFGGGLNWFRNGTFHKFTTKDGLLSNNVLHVTDDGEYLWLSTTRGICSASKRELWNLAAGKIRTLLPTNYGVLDGLRSAQSGPSHPVAGGGTRTRDGRLWFPTSRGLATLKSPVRSRTLVDPPVHIIEMKADGRVQNLAAAAEIPPGNGRIQIRYTAIHLSAPERIQYSYRLEGIDHDWVNSGNRRFIDYNGLRPGNYRFIVRASLPGRSPSEKAYAFVLRPHFYQTSWFLFVCAAAVLGCVGLLYHWRLQNIRKGFRLVLAERARLAREIHDTLAQGFAGISSQLEAVAMCIPETADAARQHLSLARKMARHSLTEARRSVMDLRSSHLEGQDLASALRAGTRIWAGTSPVDIQVDAIPPQAQVPHDVEQHLLRIAQEAVVNALKHSGASKILVWLSGEGHTLRLRVTDNGQGFDTQNVFTFFDGHFGVVGMRERAQRLHGEFLLESDPATGTTVEVKVPLR